MIKIKNNFYFLLIYLIFTTIIFSIYITFSNKGSFIVEFENHNLSSLTNINNFHKDENLFCAYFLHQIEELKMISTKLNEYKIITPNKVFVTGRNFYDVKNFYNKIDSYNRYNKNLNEFYNIVNYPGFLKYKIYAIKDSKTQLFNIFSDTIYLVHYINVYNLKIKKFLEKNSLLKIFRDNLLNFHNINYINYLDERVIIPYNKTYFRFAKIQSPCLEVRFKLINFENYQNYQYLFIVFLSISIIYVIMFLPLFLLLKYKYKARGI